MKKGNKQLIEKLRIIGIVCLLAIVGTNNASAMKYRHNVIKIKAGENLKHRVHFGMFVLNEFSITPGQDPKQELFKTRGYSLGMDRNKGELDIKVGRKKSYDVAEWFNTKIKYFKNSAYNTPDELNFALLGTLRITVSGGKDFKKLTTLTFKNIGIAQGHNYNSNNWWLGGQNCRTWIENTVVCDGLNNTYSSGQSHVILKLEGDTIYIEEVQPHLFSDRPKTNVPYQHYES